MVISAGHHPSTGLNSPLPTYYKTFGSMCASCSSEPSAHPGQHSQCDNRVLCPSLNCTRSIRASGKYPLDIKSLENIPLSTCQIYTPAPPTAPPTAPPMAPGLHTNSGRYVGTLAAGERLSSVINYIQRSAAGGKSRIQDRQTSPLGST